MMEKSAVDDARGLPVHGISHPLWLDLLEISAHFLPAKATIAYVNIGKGPGAVITAIRKEAQETKKLTRYYFLLVEDQWMFSHDESKIATSHPATISISEVASLFRDMIGQVPANAKILRLVVQSEGRIQIDTGSQTGTLGGGGRVFVFSKEDTNWKLTKELRWVS